MRHYSVYVSLWIHCVVWCEQKRYFSSQHSSADIVVYIVHLVWPAATVISGSYACLWSSAGRAEPHTSQHLVASRPCILYNYLSFPTACCVLPNSFSYCCTPDVHNSRQDGAEHGCGKGTFCKYSVVIQIHAARLDQIQHYSPEHPCAL